MWARPDLRAELKGLGLLRSPDLDQAFLHVRQESFLPESLSLLAYADMPLPVHVSANPPTMPSPRCLVAAIDLLEPEAGLRVLIAGCRGGYPAALLAEIVGPEHVVVVETDSERRTRSAGRLEAAGFGAVRVLPSIPDETFDRILVLDATPPRQLVRLLADPGSLIGRGHGVHDLAFVKLVRRSGETAQMTFNEAPSEGAEGPSETADSGPVDFGRLFAVEDLLAHAWEGRVTGHYDQHFRDLVDETIPWLERAIAAPRYCCYFYAYTNLARVYLQKGLREKARKALRQALEVNPEYEPAQELLRRIDRERGYFA